MRSRAGLLGWVLAQLRRGHDAPAAPRAATPRPGPDTLVIRAPEDISSPEAVRTIYSIAKRAIHGHSGPVCIDLGEVTRADTKIVACLVVLRRTAARADVRLDIRLSPAVAAWTGLCRLQAVLPHADPHHPHAQPPAAEPPASHAA